jgi:hypothetical protein
MSSKFEQQLISAGWQRFDMSFWIPAVADPFNGEAGLVCVVVENERTGRFTLTTGDGDYELVTEDYSRIPRPPEAVQILRFLGADHACYK